MADNGWVGRRHRNQTCPQGLSIYIPIVRQTRREPLRFCKFVLKLLWPSFGSEFGVGQYHACATREVICTQFSTDPGDLPRVYYLTRRDIARINLRDQPISNSASDKEHNIVEPSRPVWCRTPRVMKTNRFPK